MPYKSSIVYYQISSLKKRLKIELILLRKSALKKVFFCACVHHSFYLATFSLIAVIRTLNYQATVIF